MITEYNEFINENIMTSPKEKTRPEQFGIRNYKWVNGFLDCYQTVNLQNEKLKKLPFRFGKIVAGDFWCSYNNLSNLENSPSEVEGSFNCHSNKITSLKNGPQKVGIDFDCHNNKLTDLEGCPQNLILDLQVGNNTKLTSLEGCPKKIRGDFWCGHTLLKGIEDYPLCDIGRNISDKYNFLELYITIQKNREVLIPLMDNKIAFHQMAMRLNPGLIKYYTTITPPTKKSILFENI